MSKYISGVILYDETIWQNAKDGTPLVKLIEQAGAIPGIKVDEGTQALPNCPGELVTVGLDKLAERLKKYYERGARFAKWRAVIDIGSQAHSHDDRDQRQCACAGALCGAVPGRADRADRRAGSADGRRSRHRPLHHAAEHDYGVPAFNINNMEQVLAIMEAAASARRARHHPGLARRARPTPTTSCCSHMMDAVTEIYPQIPVCVHLDHGNGPPPA